MLLAVAAVFLAGSPQAATAQIAPAPLQGDDVAQPIDVVVILDDSGSMATCWPWPQGQPPFFPPCASPSPNQPSDPLELRYSAARLLVQLADAEDRVAVIRFDTVAEGVGLMGDLQPVGDGDNRRRLVDSLQPPDDYFRRGYTRIDLGLQLAMDLLASARQTGRNQYILLLTDGEPTHPAGPDGIKADIAAQVEVLRSDGVLTFPVVLCNASAGCSGDFLREQFADFGVSEAASAEDLLRIFSEIAAQMKPDRSVITGRGSALQLVTRAPQGVRSMSFVTPRGGLQSLARDDQPVLTRTALDDPNIDVSVIEAESLAEGRWTAATPDGGFVVVQAASFPQLINPPPSIADSPASVRYYPAGKPPLLIARGFGPGAGEALLYNDEALMQPFGRDDLRAYLPGENPGVVRLQLGDDQQPLQLVRSFRVEPLADLPRAEVLSPGPAADGRLADGRLRLQVGFTGGGDVQNMAATVYVSEIDRAADTRSLVHAAAMTCADRVCSDESFQPADGRDYEITYIVSAQSGDLRFSDWAQTSVGLEPAVYLRGIPAQLDLAQMPAAGWPVELTSGTVEEIGLLTAAITLRNADTGEAASGVSLDFQHDVPEEGATAANLLIEGLDTLRPGNYAGEITLEAKSPAGLPMNVLLRPAAQIDVSLTVPRPVARIRSQAVDFGDVLFDTSPNFRLDQEAFLTVDFTGRPFALTPSLESASCDGLAITAGDVQDRMGQTVLPLRLTSLNRVLPSACSGVIRFAGPDGDYDVTPDRVDWQVHVADVEWSLVDGSLNLGDLQDAGARSEQTLRLRFNGKTPFVLEMDDLQAAGSNVPDGGPSALTSEYIEMPPVEVNGSPQEDGTYLVPVTLIARRAIPHDALRGSFYTGSLGLRIAGLEGAPRQVNISLRSPSLYQRYLAPVVMPVYSLPWLFCTGPLTLLLLLVIVARVRSRGFNADEVEEAAMAAAIKTVAVQSETAGAAVEPPLPAAPNTASPAWGASEWGTVWGAQAPPDEPVKSSPTQANGHGADPWNSSW